MDTDDVRAHFTERAERYDGSSNWCTDPELMAAVLGHIQPLSHHELLDVACGTGLVSRHFKGRVARVVGCDITPAMYEQAVERLDEFHQGRGEALPFEDARFDLVTCRQGTQFMDDGAALREMARVLKPGGRVCIINLCAYGEGDREEYFEILRLRNPARCNFYLESDLERLLSQAGLEDVAVHRHISLEDVDIWSDNGAISEDRREGIRSVYRTASAAFQEHHAARSEDGTRYFDHMLFGIAIGVKPADG